MSFLVFLKTMLFLIKFHTFLPILVTKKYLKKRKYVFYFMLFTFLFLLPLVSYLYIFWRCISSPFFVAFYFFDCLDKHPKLVLEVTCTIRYHDIPIQQEDGSFGTYQLA